jgi:hypothetical protein
MLSDDRGGAETYTMRVIRAEFLYADSKGRRYSVWEWNVLKSCMAIVKGTGMLHIMIVKGAKILYDTNEGAQMLHDDSRRVEISFDYCGKRWNVRCYESKGR